MIRPFLILNERDARDAKSALAEIDSAMASETQFEKIVAGLPLTLVNGYSRALKTQKHDILNTLEAYENAKSGNYAEFVKRAGNDIGSLLMVARIVKNYSQKDLARRVGLKEQQIQRYEADRYRSITMSGFRRIAQALGVELKLEFSNRVDPWFASHPGLISDYGTDEILKVIRHAKENRWFENSRQEDEESERETLQRFISDHLLKYGSPALLRTGLNVNDLSNDLLLVAWKAKVAKTAEEIISNNKVTYSEIDISWLSKISKLSMLNNGPALAKNILLQHGIVLVIEPQIPGLKMDGAAFLVDDVPVIGMTLRRDTLDNFWFTLLHELAHIILHYRMGLSVGFYDDNDNVNIDEIEQEANDFASNLLIPEEIWKRSPARISKVSEPIDKFANSLGIHPAIVYGRIQKERNDYTIFSNKIGRGEVRKQFSSHGGHE